MTATVTVLRTPYERGFESGRNGDPPLSGPVRERNEDYQLFHRGWLFGQRIKQRELKLATKAKVPSI